MTVQPRGSLSFIPISLHMASILALTNDYYIRPFFKVASYLLDGFFVPSLL